VPVVVTGASGFVAGHLIPLLVARGYEVRAVLRDRGRADALRASGVKVAVTRLQDEDTLEAVARDAHTVIHLAGGLDLPDPDAYERVNHELTRSVVAASEEAGVKRFILLSYPGASPDAENPYLRSKGRAEEAVRAGSFQHVVLRSTHVYGRGSRWLAEFERAARGPVAAVVVGPGTQRVAPVHVQDVAQALAAADDRRAELTGTYAIRGPDVVTADELADILAGRSRRKIHLSPAAAARAARLQGRRLSPAMLEVLAADSLADAPDAAEELGLDLTPLREGLAESVER
jgi:NADH dehydrogenase